jgi:hypothetical protein
VTGLGVRAVEDEEVGEAGHGQPGHEGARVGVVPRLPERSPVPAVHLEAR